MTANWLQSRSPDTRPLLNSSCLFVLFWVFLMRSRINHRCWYFWCWLLTHHSSLISKLIQTGSPVKLQNIDESMKTQRCSVWFTASSLWSHLPEGMFEQRLLFYCKLPAERSISGSPAKERQAPQLLCIHTESTDSLHRTLNLNVTCKQERVTQGWLIKRAEKEHNSRIFHRLWGNFFIFG